MDGSAPGAEPRTGPTAGPGIGPGVGPGVGPGAGAASGPDLGPPDLARLTHDLAALARLAEGWGAAERAGAEAWVRAADRLNAEAFRRLIRALRDLPGAADALKAAAADEVVYAVLRRHGLLKPSLNERVEAALDAVRPMLASHGGDVELVSVAGDTAEVRFLGACDGCPASQLTFYAGVKTAIQERAPEIAHVRQVQGLGGARGPGGPDGGRAGGPVVSPFASPGRADGWRPALGAEDLADGATRIVEIDGRSVLVSRFGDRLTCFENACAHMGLGMERGVIGDGLITCPHHGFVYALETGECLTAPEVQLAPVPVRARAGWIEVRPEGARP